MILAMLLGMLGFFKKKDTTSFEALGILGLHVHATKKEIHSAYVEKMRIYHPDHGGDQFIAAQINWARDILVKQAK